MKDLIKNLIKDFKDALKNAKRLTSTKNLAAAAQGYLTELEPEQAYIELTEGVAGIVVNRDITKPTTYVVDKANKKVNFSLHFSIDVTDVNITNASIPIPCESCAVFDKSAVDNAVTFSNALIIHGNQFTLQLPVTVTPIYKGKSAT